MSEHAEATSSQPSPEGLRARGTRSIGDLELFPMGLGCMGFSDPPNIAHRDRSIATVHAALDAGLQLLDTANIYAPAWDQVGHNEAVVAEAVRTWAGDQTQVVIATKGGLVRGEGETWRRDGTTAGLVGAARRSAEVLGTDTIDLYFLHRLDPDTHFNDQVEALMDVQREGVAKRIGLSNITAAHLERALELGADLAAVQNEFSLRYRRDADVLDICNDRGIAFLPWSPLGGSRDAASMGGRYGVVGEIAAAHGASVQQVTLAWLRALSPVLIPIPGASRPESALGSIAALDVVLDAEEFERINATEPEDTSVFPDDVPAPPM